MLTNRKIDLDTQQTIGKPVVFEQNEWARDKLTEIWGDNKADYFVNPSRAPRKSSQDVRIQEDIHKNLSDPRNRGSSRSGLYAYMIWDNLRDDAKSKYKVYSIEKDLQNLNYYERVKEKLADDFAKSTGNLKLNKENETTKLNNKYCESSRIRRNKIFRSEIELMYRSSKMNENKVSMMRANGPLPDMNDSEGKDSIIRYLPPIINLNNDQLKSTRHNNNSNLEFISSHINQKKYKKKLDEHLAKQGDHANFQMIENTKSNQSGRNSNLKMETQNIKLHFLSERPAREYMGSKGNDIENGDTNRSLYTDTTQSDNMSQLKIEDSKTKELEYQLPEKSENALVPYDSKAVSYPPLSMHALMEYKPMIKAPGIGDFENGKRKLFKLEPC